MIFKTLHRKLKILILVCIFANFEVTRMSFSSSNLVIVYTENPGGSMS